VLKRYIAATETLVVNYGGKYQEAKLNASVNTDKLAAMRKMKEGGLQVPNFYIRGETVPERDFPVMARTATHSNGRDIIMVNNDALLSRVSYDLAVQYISKDAEYRVHILKGPGDSEKHRIYLKSNVNPDADNTVCSDDSWRHLRYDEERYPRYSDALLNLARTAVTALGYDFGAVDIIRKGDNFYVLEVNSGPWLNADLVELYATYLEDWR